MKQHLIYKPNTCANIVVTEEEMQHMRSHGTLFDDFGVICQEMCSSTCPWHASGTCPCKSHRSLYGEIIRTFPKSVTPPSRFVEV